MITQFFATKVSTGQVWTKSGQRLVVSRLSLQPHVVLSAKNPEKDGRSTLVIGYGRKKLKNMTKSLRSIVEKSGFSFGVRQFREVATDETNTIQVGQQISLDQVVSVGAVVNIQGTSKGRGHAGVVKRHHFRGGPRTHGQSDRERAPGAIGQRTTPGRVFKGKRMAGQYGNKLVTVKNLQVVYFEPSTQELWVSGPVPGSINSTVRLSVQPEKKEFDGLDESTVKTAFEVEAKVNQSEVESVVNSTETEESTQAESANIPEVKE